MKTYWYTVFPQFKLSCFVARAVLGEILTSARANLSALCVVLCSFYLQILYPARSCESLGLVQSSRVPSDTKIVWSLRPDLFRERIPLWVHPGQRSWEFVAPSNQNEAKNIHHNKTPTKNAKRFRMCREPNFSKSPKLCPWLKKAVVMRLWDLLPESSLELFGFTEVNIVNN